MWLYNKTTEIKPGSVWIDKDGNQFDWPELEE